MAETVKQGLVRRTRAGSRPKSSIQTHSRRDKMSERKVHLRPNRVIDMGNTKTYCGRTIYYVGHNVDLSAAVVDFGDFDATVHGTLVTCAKCLKGTYHAANPQEKLD
jgi:hypothetical protein